MIEAAGVTKTYPAAGSEVVAVDRVHFDVKTGDFVLISGCSGSGKSTLLGMLAGLIRPTTGTILFQGEDIGTLHEARVSGLRAQEIGFVFQFSGLIPTITALENVMLPTLFFPSPSGNRARALELLHRVGMSHRVDAYPGTLSSGEMKRVAIARALMNNPGLIIADEPTGDLDAETEYEVMELFRSLNREGKTIIMVTHNPDLIPYATRIYGMDRGRLEKTIGALTLSKEGIHIQTGEQA